MNLYNGINVWFRWLPLNIKKVTKRLARTWTQSAASKAASCSPPFTLSFNAWNCIKFHAAQIRVNGTCSHVIQRGTDGAIFFDNTLALNRAPLNKNQSVRTLRLSFRTRQNNHPYNNTTPFSNFIFTIYVFHLSCHQTYSYRKFLHLCHMLRLLFHVCYLREPN